MIRSAMHTNPTSTFGDRDKYKGNIINNKPYGLGAYYWGDSGGFYFGGWREYNREGYGILISSDFESREINNCSGCVVYVGSWSNDDKSGKGTCYDKNGRLIYYGDFINDKPTETYPSTGDYSKYKFENHEYNWGDAYLGETIDGVREGHGIYFWQDGKMWFGGCKDDERNGGGIEISNNGVIKSGTWQKGTCIEECESLNKLSSKCYSSSNSTIEIFRDIPTGIIDIIRAGIITTAGAAVPGTLIPLLDVGAITGAWAVMFVNIANYHHTKLNVETCTKIITGCGAGVFGYLGGSKIFTFLLNAIPGIGTLGAMGINATLNAYFTYAMGKAFHKMLEINDINDQTLDEIAAILLKYFVPIPSLSEIKEIFGLVKEVKS